MKEHVFKINPDGTVIGLYTDAVPLHTLGALHVERASSVEFNNVQQAWVVTLADGTVLPGTFTTREDALAREVAHLHAELKGEPAAPREGLVPGPIELDYSGHELRVHTLRTLEETTSDKRWVKAPAHVTNDATRPIIENMRELHAIVSSSALGTCRNGHRLCLKAECHVPTMSVGEALWVAQLREDRIAQQEFCEHDFMTAPAGGRSKCGWCGAFGSAP